MDSSIDSTSAWGLEPVVGSGLNPGKGPLLSWIKIDNNVAFECLALWYMVDTKAALSNHTKVLQILDEEGIPT